MFATQRHNFEPLRGGTFDPTFTIALDLTGWTVEIEFASLTLTAGHGLTVTITPAAGDIGPSTLIAAVLTPEQTSAQRAGGNFRWHMQLTDPAGRVGFPIAGTMLFVDP